MKKIKGMPVQVFKDSSLETLHFLSKLAYDSSYFDCYTNLDDCEQDWRDVDVSLLTRRELKTAWKIINVSFFRNINRYIRLVRSGINPRAAFLGNPSVNMQVLSKKLGRIIEVSSYRMAGYSGDKLSYERVKDFLELANSRLIRPSYEEPLGYVSLAKLSEYWLLTEFSSFSVKERRIVSSHVSVTIPKIVNALNEFNSHKKSALKMGKLLRLEKLISKVSSDFYSIAEQNPISQGLGNLGEAGTSDKVGAESVDIDDVKLGEISECVFVNNEVESAWLELKSVLNNIVSFQRVSVLGISVEDQHFLQEVVNSYAPRAVEAYRPFEVPDTPRAAEAREVMLSQLMRITDKLQSIQKVISNHSLNELTNQDEFVRQASAL